MSPRGLLLAAPASGAGKTVVTLGLLGALRARGVQVAAGKSGPDYIDPEFHAAATGRPSTTLDAWAMDRESLCARAAAAPGDLLLVEGAMGVLDGARPDGAGSAADLAEALGLPVVLLLDIARSAQSAALAPMGLRALRPGLELAGAILNRVGTPAHGEMAATALARAGVPVLGQVPRDPGLALPERHLGLVLAREHPALPQFLARAAEMVGAAVDLGALLSAARPLRPGAAARALPPLGQRIAVAEDAAFAFAYPHLLADWRAAGAEIRHFSPLSDAAPDPEADAVFLPGGYPELWAGRLASAGQFRAGMARAAASGAAIYGECGGYMALGRALTDADGHAHAMLGLLPVETSFAARRLTLGYRRLQALGPPWRGALRGHEFHYATVTAAGPAPPLFRATDAAGADLGQIGQVVGRVSGSFAHAIAPG